MPFRWLRKRFGSLRRSNAVVKANGLVRSLTYPVDLRSSQAVPGTWIERPSLPCTPAGDAALWQGDGRMALCAHAQTRVPPPTGTLRVRMPACYVVAVDVGQAQHTLSN